MNKIVTHSPEETEKIAKDWIAELIKSAPEGKSVVVGLSGHLGSGKTAFVKGVAKALGLTETVTSPTFVIIKSYVTENFRFRKLVHIDAYRLSKSQELDALGFKKITDDPSALILIEWPENVKESLAGSANIFFETGTTDGRTISFA